GLLDHVLRLGRVAQHAPRQGRHRGAEALEQLLQRRHVLPAQGVDELALAGFGQRDLLSGAGTNERRQGSRMAPVWARAESAATCRESGGGWPAAAAARRRRDLAS